MSAAGRTQRVLAYVRDEDLPKGMSTQDFHAQLLDRLKAWVGSDLTIELAGDDMNDRELLCLRLERMVKDITGWPKFMWASPPDPPNGHSFVIMGRSVETNYRGFCNRWRAAHPTIKPPGVLELLLAKPPTFVLGLSMTFDHPEADRAAALAVRRPLAVFEGGV